MKTTVFFKSTGRILAIAMACIMAVDAAKLPCLCGGLGNGRDACACSCTNSGQLVKAVDLPRTFYHASAEAINKAELHREASLRSEMSVQNGGCGTVTRTEYIDDGPTAQELLSLPPNTPIVHKLRPIGSVCDSPSHRMTPGSCQVTTVLPAKPSPLKCTSCKGPLRRRGGSSSTSASKLSSGSTYASSHDYSQSLKSDDESICRSCSMKKSRPHHVKSSYASGSYYSAPVTHGISYNEGHRYGGASGSNGYTSVSGSNGFTSHSGSNGFESVSGSNAHHAMSFASVSGSGIASSGSHASAHVQGSFDGDFDAVDCGPSLTFADQEKIYNGASVASMPADAVSITLAHKKRLENVQMSKFNQQKRVIPEERLLYGHRSPPVNGRVQQKKTINVPEEKLQIIDKPIIELKSLSTASKSGGGGWDCVEIENDEEIAMNEALAREQMQLESYASQNSKSGSRVTYGETGYDVVAPTVNKFINTGASTVTEYSSRSDKSVFADESPCGPIGAPLPGHRAGDIIIERERGSNVVQHRHDDSNDDVDDRSDVRAIVDEIDNASSEITSEESNTGSVSSMLADLWRKSNDYSQSSCQ